MNQTTINILRLDQEPDFLNSNELSDLVHQLSHDIGNPLTAIVSYSSILEQADNYKLPLDKVSNYSSNITIEAWRISRLMEKFLLLLSKKTIRNNCSLSDLKSKIESRANSRYALSDLEIIFDNFSSDILIPADIDQLTSVLCEIASNALSVQKSQNKIEENNKNVLSLKAFVDDNFITLEAKNPSPLHSNSLAELASIGIKENCDHKDALGIGLPAIHSCMIRWGGFMEIEQKTENSTNFFLTRLFFPSEN